MPLLTTQSARGYGFTRLSASVANSFESISTVNVTGSSTTSISFTSIPNTYKHLQIRILTRGTVAQTEMQIMTQLNNDTGSNYAYHGLRGDGSNPYSYGGNSVSNIYGMCRFSAASATTGNFGAGIIDILDYSSTSKNKTIRAISGTDNNGSTGQIYFTSGLWLGTSAVSSIKFEVQDGGGFAINTSFALYGIKGA